MYELNRTVRAEIIGSKKILMPQQEKVNDIGLEPIMNLLCP